MLCFEIDKPREWGPDRQCNTARFTSQLSKMASQMGLGLIHLLDTNTWECRVVHSPFIKAQGDSQL
jgi:hypothetical protein